MPYTWSSGDASPKKARDSYMPIEMGTAQKNTNGDRTLVPMLRDGRQFGQAVLLRGTDGKIAKTSTFLMGESVSDEIQDAADRCWRKNLALLEAMLPSVAALS
jgi:hypothetical protein